MFIKEEKYKTTMIPLTKEQIDQVFNSSAGQYDFAVGMYKIAFPDFDNIEFIDGWPRVSRETAEYIMDKAMAIDKEFHPDVICGGLWMNKGFSCNNPIEQDWMIDISHCKIIYNEQQQEKTEKIQVTQS